VRTRREFLQSLAMAAATGSVLSHGMARFAVAAKKKPNLLFVMTDQQLYDMIDQVNPQLQTPVLDGLAWRSTCSITTTRIPDNSTICSVIWTMRENRPNWKR